MGKVICAIEKCGRTRENPNTDSKVSFFSFPKDNPQLQQWLDFINEHNETKLNKKSLDRKRMRLCNLHFQPKDIRGKAERLQLFPNSVPKLLKSKPKSSKSKSNAQPAKEAPETVTSLPPDAAKSTTPSETPLAGTASESTPLYHSINGYVVDLRFASQLEMFRLPNGKLIQVRKQSKKPSATTTSSNGPVDDAPEGKEKARDKLPLVTVEKVVGTKKKRTSKKGIAAPLSEPEKTPTPAQYKTYSNRKSQAATSRVSQVSAGPDSISLSDAPVSASVRPTNPMPNQAQPQKPRRPIVAPCLTALQELIYKTHDEMTPFDLFQKQFENQLISTAEIALHLVAKINNLVSSNPFKTAETEPDLKYMYHHVGYIVKYAIDRFTGILECCANDIKDMGFTTKADLGPVFGAEKNPEQTEPKPPAEKPTEPEPKEADEDCAIVEEQPDMIEIDSEDDDGDDQPPKNQPTTPVKSNPEPAKKSSPLRKSPNESEQQQHQFIISEIDEPRGVIQQDSETTLKIANVIGQYYAEESSDSSESDEEEEEDDDDDEAEEDKAEAPSKQQAVDEPMEVDGQPTTERDESSGDSTVSAEEDDDGEETTELIEIIDGDEEGETEADNDPEYGVVECGDGDYYLVTTDGDAV